MPKTVVICEKSSQAKDLKTALGTKFGQILPARGHILTLKEPDDIREDWKTWSAELLYPGGFYPKQPVADAQQLLSAIRVAISDADEVIIATDCDREGQLIGDEILEFLRFKGKVKRAMFTAQDPKSLQKAFANLEDNAVYRGRYMAGQAREQADQITNLSLTRTATTVMKKPGNKGAIGIGRVKTPVLGIVCKRELEIENFKPQDMFEIVADVAVENGDMSLSCSRLPPSLVKEKQLEADPDGEEDELAEGEEALAAADDMIGKIMRRDVADQLAIAAKGFKGPLSAKFEKKRQGPPKLFDLSALQAACSARYGWGAEQTLNVAQSLYAAPHHIITYPRGEAQYLPENEIANVPAVKQGLLEMGAYGKHAQLVAKPEIRRGKAGHFSDKALEGFSHYAVIPNVNAPRPFAEVWPLLNDEQKKMFDLVARQYLAALAPDHEYRQTSVQITVPWKNHDWAFTNSGRVPLVLGWKEIIGSGGPSKDAESEFPQMKNGETAEVVKASVRASSTRPPARYSDGTLIKVMKEAWRLVDDPVKRKRLKEATGIGTAATRGQVVEGLLKQGQIAKIGKMLKPTDGGMQVYKALMISCPNVVDPGRTAVWETIFDRVESGAMTAEDAVSKINAMTLKEIANIRGSNVQIDIGGKSKPTPKMIAAAKTIAERKNIKLPAGALTDSSKCGDFLKEHLPPREKNADGTDKPFGPSEKQLAMARELSERANMEIPKAALANARELSSFIDSAMKKAPGRPPSEKQVEFAQKLAGEAGMEIPKGAMADGKLLSKFIEDAKKQQPARPPSEKQLAMAEKLAEEKGVDVPAAATTDMKQCSAFIDLHMKGGKKSENAPGY